MTSPKAASPTEPADPAAPLVASLVASLLLVSLASPAGAGDVRIVDARIDCADRSCRFDVTLEHADTRWNHYADEWRVLDPNGNVLGVRPLAHPHVDEQPFTRSLAGVTIPGGVDRVIIGARDSVHGRSDRTLELSLDLP